MSIVFKPDETFRGDYSYRNSEAAILRFPFPFPQDQYLYSVNMEPHQPKGASPAYQHAFDVDEHYIAECRDKAITLERDPGRCQVLPHMALAEWDTLELLMDSLSADYPEHFSLAKTGTDFGARWTWINRPLGIEQEFVFGDAATLPCGPFEYITRQAQGDFAICDQREDNLFLDAGMVTSQADWSLDFNVGMSFMQWHGPVPLAHQAGVFERALKYLLLIRQGQPVRRLNWTMTVNPRLDTAPETFPEWGPDRASLTPENIGRKLHLRVELQTLWRLPRSNALLFPIRCYLASLDELVRVPKWGKRLSRVLATLPPPLAEYKGLSRFLPTAVAYLAAFDDGGAISQGPEAETAELAAAI